MKNIARFLAGVFVATLVGLALYAVYPSHGVARADLPIVFMGSFLSLFISFLLGWTAMSWDQERMGDY